MVNKATAQLVEEVFGYFNERSREKAQAEPEACLVSMLLVIKEQLPHTCATLRQTIQQAPYDGNLREAKEKLGQTT